MSSPIRPQAIVGLGWWGPQPRRVRAAHSETIRFTTAHTRTAASVADFCRQHDLHWVDDLNTIFCKTPAIDAVVFATPHTLHARPDQTRRPLPAKLCLSRSPSPCRSPMHKPAIVAAENRRHRACGWFSTGAFIRPWRLLRQAVKQQTARHHHHRQRRADFAAWSGAHRATPGRAQSGESPGWRHDSHRPCTWSTAMIDLMGRVDTVWYCRVARRAAPYSDDTTDILLTLANGAAGHIFCSVAATPNYRMGRLRHEGFSRKYSAHPMQTYRLVPATDGDNRGAAPPAGDRDTRASTC